MEYIVLAVALFTLAMVLKFQYGRPQHHPQGQLLGDDDDL